jgi:endonuclease/exonuclease/phosphatase family metal-dependent hydrolase
MKRFPLAIVVLLAIASVSAAAVAAKAASPDTLRVVTLNLWNDQGDWPRRLSRIVAGLRAERPDVLCLQEVLQHPGLPNQARTIADSLGFAWHFVSVDDTTRPKRYGNAILSPHRMLMMEGRNLLPANDYRVAAHVRLEVRGRALDVYDTHLHHTAEGGAIRATQIADLLGFVDSTRAAGSVVLAGDFNAGLDAPEMAPVLASWRDAYRALHPQASAVEAETLNPAFGYAPVTIDHVFVPRDPARTLAPLEARILFRGAGPDSVWATDHFGVAAAFAWPAAVRSRAPAH